jgi:hypothetical protein
MFNPAFGLEEHQIGLVFSLAPSAGSRYQKDFTHQSNPYQAPLMIMK